MGALDKPLSEGQLAAVAQGMEMCSRAGRALDRVMGEIQHCRVSIEGDSLKHVRHYLDELHASLSAVPLAHIDAIERERAGR